MLVTDTRRARMPLLDLAFEAVAGGVDAIYLRDIDLPRDELTGLLRRLRQRIGDEIALLINGGPEVALATGASLQLRERDRDLKAARTLLGPNALIGCSVHAPERAAVARGADYVLAGHVYPSASKPHQPPLGLGGLAAIVAAAPCPTIAIGGITPERVAPIVRAGASGIAVIGAIVATSDPRAAANALRQALVLAWQERKESAPMQQDAVTTNEIVANGKTIAIPDGLTLHDFLASKGMTDAMAIVERNGAIVPRVEYGSTELQTGDRLEVVHAVGGG